MTDKTLKEMMQDVEKAEINIARLKRESLMLKVETIGFIVGFIGSIVIYTIVMCKKAKRM